MQGGLAGVLMRLRDDGHGSVHLCGPAGNMHLSDMTDSICYGTARPLATTLSPGSPRLAMAATQSVITRATFHQSP